MKVGQQHLCSGHALAQRCTFMGHQRQQPLQRVGCLGQAMYQAGLVAAACGSSCALPAPSPFVRRLDCFRHGGIFCACGTVRCPKACTSRLWSGPPMAWPLQRTRTGHRAPAQHLGDALPLPGPHFGGRWAAVQSCSVLPPSAHWAKAPAGQCKQQPGRCRKLWICASAPPTVCYPLGVPLRRHQQATSAISAPPAQRCNAGFVGLQARLQNVGFGVYQLAYRLFAHQLNARVRRPKAEVF